MDKYTRELLQQIQDKLNAIQQSNSQRLTVLEERQGHIRETLKTWSDTISNIVKKLLLIFAGIILSGLVSGWSHGKQILDWVLGR